MSALSKTARIALSVVAWTAMLAVVAMVVATVAAPKALGWKPFTILTGSMRPAIDPGDVVVDEQVPASSMRPRQIITFREPGSTRLITHRLVSVTPNGANLDVVTRGDANATSERWTIPATGKVGRVRYTVPKAGYLLQWTRKPQGKLLLIVIPVVILGLWELIRIWRPRDEEFGDAAEA